MTKAANRFTIIGTAAVLLVITSAILCVYYAERLLVPERTSQEYKDLRSGAMQIPAIITISHPEGTVRDIAKYLEDSRRAYLARALETERRIGRQGVITWGSVAAIAALSWWTVRRFRRNKGIAAV